MRRTHTMLFLLIVGTILNAGSVGATVSSVTVNVPHKAGPAFEIARLKVTLALDGEAAVTFKISHANGSQVIGDVTTNAMSPGTTTNCFLNGNCFNIYPVGPSGRSDIVSISPPPNAAMGDPARKKYTFIFNLDGNSKVDCSSSLGADEQWTITRMSGPMIDKICAQSLDHQTAAIGVCTNALLRVVPQADGVATVTGPAANQQGCRVGVDCILVLDRSGSMEDPVSSGGGAPKKIKRLGDSVANFIVQWDGVRSNEAAEVVSPSDQIGVVFFDSNANWLNELTGSATPSGLGAYPTFSADIKTNAPTVPSNSATSIGGGLKKAADAFTAGSLAANRKVILLMTDGMQNTDPMARIDPMNPKQVQTTIGNAATNLVNQPPLQIYALTVGTGMFVDDAINQQLAQATNGFLLNTETDSTVLPTLFTELLQNFVKFATVETLRIIGEDVKTSAPFVTTIPVTRTMKSIIFNLTWEDNAGVLRLIIDPPNGRPQIVRDIAAGDPPGSVSVPLSLLGTNPSGDWKVTVQALRARAGHLPFSFIALGDDGTIDSDLNTVATEYHPGDRIVVHASVRELEKPLTALGSSIGDQVVAQLVAPGASLGDLLSASNASSTPPPGGESMTPAEAKLRNMLLADPNAIPRQKNVITLTDDGNAANGDAVAGDGIYSGSFPAQLEGHYNFLIAVEGQTPSSGRFSRQQLRTVYVKPMPDPGNTQVSSTTQSTASGNFVVVQVTPRTKTGHLTGPGAGPYLWVTTTTGVAIPMHDNLNGTYSATFPFTGSAPPFDVHFINNPVKIPETITSPGNLPVPLGPGNVLVGGVNPGGGGGGGGPTAGTLRFFVDIGPNFPHGSFGNGTDGKFSINAGIERFITADWSVEGIFGYHRFDSTFVSNPHILQLSVDAKRYFGIAPWHWFIDAGVGGYRFDPGNTTKFGGNAGGGVLYEVNAKWGIEGVYQFHTVSTSGSSTQFSTVQAGVRIRF